MTVPLPSSTQAGLPPDTLVCEDAGSVAREAAARILQEIRTNGEGPLAICLSGGSTPKRLYELLAGPLSGDVPWGRVHWFFGDERLVPADHPDSNFRMIRESLLTRAPVPPENIHRVATEGRSAEEAAAAYGGVLAGFYGAGRLDPGRPLFDVVLLGLGEDGHTASLFPGSPALDERERLAVGVAEAGQPPFVPRVTLTRPALASCRGALVLVSGHAKHPALSRIAAGEPLPAGIVAEESRATWLVDRAAATGETHMSTPKEGTRERKGMTAFDPSVLIAMGVSGSGKTTIAALLARRLGWAFEDGDWFHPKANVDKMAAGQPLTDDDRWPWLEAIASWIDATRKAGHHGVVACSALKREYRAVLVGGHPEAARIVFLDGDQKLIGARMRMRHEHFMPTSLLDSQFATLERPEEGERPITVSIEPHPREIVENIVKAFEAELGHPLPPGP